MIREQRAGKLLVKLFPDRQELGKAAALDAVQALNKVIGEKGQCNVIFAAAPSQNEFLEALCSSSVDWTKVNAFHMDEYIGLSTDAPQGFGNFLKQAILGRLPFRKTEYINGNVSDVSLEIERYSELIRRYPPDMVFMGIGENGHIAFNDPHVSHFDDGRIMQEVRLDEKCRQQQVNDGCFSSLDRVPSRALTLTIPILMSAKSAFCMVPAASKADAVAKTVFGEIRETLPASILRLHPNAVLYIDKDSGHALLDAGKST